jgi:hypothetical protein
MDTPARDCDVDTTAHAHDDYYYDDHGKDIMPCMLSKQRLSFDTVTEQKNYLKKSAAFCMVSRARVYVCVCVCVCVCARVCIQVSVDR